MHQQQVPAPLFTLAGTDGESIERVSLAEFLADGPAVLVFYPHEFGPDEQPPIFDRAEWLCLEDSVDVVGLTSNDPETNRAFVRRVDLQFPLLSDPHGTVASDYGAVVETAEHHHAILHRTLVAVDADRRVREVWEADHRYQVPDPEEVRELLAWHTGRGSGAMP